MVSPVGSASLLLFALAGEANAPTLFEMPAVAREDVPLLPPLRAEERVGWDLCAQGAAARHPVSLVRRRLQALEVRPIEACFRVGRYFRP